MRGQTYIYIFLLAVLCFNTNALAQEIENRFENRTAIELSYKHEKLKDFKLSIKPELRIDKDLHVDKYVVKTDISYKPASFVRFETGYRFIADNKESTKYFHQYQISMRAKKDFARVESFFRVRYTNYADDGFDANKYLRLKAGATYDIYDCRLTPIASAEVFQDVTNNQRYKMRYAAKANYKINSKNALEIGYKFDFYNLKYLNKHIVAIAYLFDL